MVSVSDNADVGSPVKSVPKGKTRKIRRAISKKKLVRQVKSKKGKKAETDSSTAAVCI